MSEKLQQKRLRRLFVLKIGGDKTRVLTYQIESGRVVSDYTSDDVVSGKVFKVYRSLPESDHKYVQIVDGQIKDVDEKTVETLKSL